LKTSSFADENVSPRKRNEDAEINGITAEKDKKPGHLNNKVEIFGGRGRGLHVYSCILLKVHKNSAGNGNNSLCGNTKGR